MLSLATNPQHSTSNYQLLSTELESTGLDWQLLLETIPTISRQLFEGVQVRVGSPTPGLDQIPQVVSWVWKPL